MLEVCEEGGEDGKGGVRGFVEGEVDAVGGCLVVPLKGGRGGWRWGGSGGGVEGGESGNEVKEGLVVQIHEFCSLVGRLML